jgi:hypothetical protein
MKYIYTYKVFEDTSKIEFIKIQGIDDVNFGFNDGLNIFSCPSNIISVTPPFNHQVRALNA